MALPGSTATGSGPNVQNISKESVLLIKKLHADAKLPSRGSAEAAGLDLYSVGDYTIPARGHAMIPTGIACAVPKGHVGLIQDRSGLASKGITTRGLADKERRVVLHDCYEQAQSMVLTQQPLGGVIDSDYRGEWKVILANLTDNDYTIKKGDRIAQFIVLRLAENNLIECELLPAKETTSLDDTERGTGGLGSTGK